MKPIRGVFLLSVESRKSDFMDKLLLICKIWLLIAPMPWLACLVFLSFMFSTDLLLDDHSNGCKCPPGFKGDGLKNCEDVNECEEKTACQCRGCKCKNTWGSYECTCSGSLVYIREHDICISKDARGDVSWGVIWIMIMELGSAAFGAYTLYRYRIRTYMDSEIRAIMAQYMPLDQPSSQLEL